MGFHFSALPAGGAVERTETSGSGAALGARLQTAAS